MALFVLVLVSVHVYGCSVTLTDMMTLAVSAISGTAYSSPRYNVRMRFTRLSSAYALPEIAALTIGTVHVYV